MLRHVAQRCSAVPAATGRILAAQSIAIAGAKAVVPMRARILVVFKRALNALKLISALFKQTKPTRKFKFT